MRVYAVVFRTYPNILKPYYDSQFADLLRRGHELTIFALGSPPPNAVVNEKVIEYGLAARTKICPDELRRLPAFGALICRNVMRSPASRFVGACRIVRRAPSGLRQRVRAAARYLSMPLEQPDLILIHGLGAMIRFGWLRKIYPKARIALFYHGGGLLGASPQALFDPVDVVFSNTEHSIERVADLGCPREKVTKLPVGFDLGEYVAPRPRAYRPDSVLRLISASRLDEAKGVTIALDALRQLRTEGFTNFRYRILGGGEARTMLEAKVQEAGLTEHVSFEGVQPSAMVSQALGESDALLLTSIPLRDRIETQAAVVQEAMLMEAVVVTSRVGGVPESIAPEMKPFSVPCGDAAAIADRIKTLATVPIAELQRLGTAGREWTAARYDIRELNSHMLDALVSIKH